LVETRRLVFSQTKIVLDEFMQKLGSLEHKFQTFTLEYTNQNESDHFKIKKSFEDLLKSTENKFIENDFEIKKLNHNYKKINHKQFKFVESLEFTINEK
jgi:hypothetical protein